MIRSGRSQDGDLFLDYGVTGNQLSRAGLDALIRTALTDPGVSHVLIPRRDRFARPDDPIDAMKMENLLREAGLTLVFMDRVVPPLERGRRRDVGELIVAMLDYNHAGEFRRDLAQKMIYAQTALAKAGFSVGGRPPFGFRRWLARDDGTPVRQLVEGEYVKMAGHHVVWLPGPEEELAVIRRILEMLETMPASRVAATLTAEGVPTPDAGRTRVDGGVRHATSGVWNQPTITNIARNPLLRAVMAYGRRSMGDQLRYSAGRPPDAGRVGPAGRRQAEGRDQPRLGPAGGPGAVRAAGRRRSARRPAADARRAGGHPAGQAALARARRATRWAAGSSTCPAAGRCTASRTTGPSAICAGCTSRATGPRASTTSSTGRSRPGSCWAACASGC